MSAAAYLGKAGFQVQVLEKNEGPGGRASFFEAEGFKFDMGPSWYWMPEVFEKFYSNFGHSVNDFYSLDRLDPSYQVIFKDGILAVPASAEALAKKFETLEPGSGAKLLEFIEEAGEKYRIAMSKMVYKPGLKLTEFLDPEVIKSASKMHLLKDMRTYVRKTFKHPWIQMVLEFPVLFLGGEAKNIPALYSLMNYADLKLGTWYPQGGMHEISKAFYEICKEQGVQFHFNEEVAEVYYSGKKIDSVETKSGKIYTSDFLINAGDYHHFDQKILNQNKSQYSAKYWDKRDMAPSSMLFFLGVNKRVKNILHHNLFFDANFDEHAEGIYKNPNWVENPLFYICCPSLTDSSVAPAGKENLFILIPSAPGLSDSEAIQDQYYNNVMSRLEELTGEEIRSEVIYKRCFSIDDFKTRYHAFKGNAYGLANTLKQTANLKPKVKSSKFNNLYHAGQLTVPGPGVPPSIISGELVADLIIKQTS